METEKKRRKQKTDLQPENGSAPAAAAGSAEIVSADITYFKNRILECISEYEIENNVKVKEIKKTEWNAVLIYIYNHVFKRISDPHKNIQKNNIDYSNIDLLLDIADFYIYISLLNNKDVSINGFSYLTGIPLYTLKRWKTGKYKSYVYMDLNTNRVIDNNTADKYISAYKDHTVIKISNSDYMLISEKLNAAREHTLADLALDGSVMSLALGKIEYGWIEGKDKQLAAEMLQQQLDGKDLLSDYKKLYIESAEQ